MKCYKCGNDIEENLECPFCGYINKEETKKKIRVSDSKIDYYNYGKESEKYKNDKVSNKVINVICKILCYIQVALIYVSCENKKFTFYFKYNDNVIEFYYMKDNEKIYLIPINKNINYTYIESEKEKN